MAKTKKATTKKATAPEKEVEVPAVENKAPAAPKAEPKEVIELSNRNKALSDMRVSVNVLIAKCDTYADLRNIRISDLKNTLQKSLVKLR